MNRAAVRTVAAGAGNGARQAPDHPRPDRRPRRCLPRASGRGGAIGQLRQAGRAGRSCRRSSCSHDARMHPGHGTAHSRERLAQSQASRRQARGRDLQIAVRCCCRRSQLPGSSGSAPRWGSPPFPDPPAMWWRCSTRSSVSSGPSPSWRSWPVSAAGSSPTERGPPAMITKDRNFRPPTTGPALASSG